MKFTKGEVRITPFESWVLHKIQEDLLQHSAPNSRPARPYPSAPHVAVHISALFTETDAWFCRMRDPKSLRIGRRWIKLGITYSLLVTTLIDPRTNKLLDRRSWSTDSYGCRWCRCRRRHGRSRRCRWWGHRNENTVSATAILSAITDAWHVASRVVCWDTGRVDCITTVWNFYSI